MRIVFSLRLCSDDLQIDHETLLAEKDEEIRYLRAALEAAKYRLAGTTRIVQHARAIDLYSEKKKKTIFGQINEKIFEKAAKIRIQLRKIAHVLRQKKRQLGNKIRRLIGKENLHTDEDE